MFLKHPSYFSNRTSIEKEKNPNQIKQTHNTLLMYNDFLRKETVYSIQVPQLKCTF